jgi:hypothetical protein
VEATFWPSYLLTFSWHILRTPLNHCSKLRLQAQAPARAILLSSPRLAQRISALNHDEYEFPQETLTCSRNSLRNIERYLGSCGSHKHACLYEFYSNRGYKGIVYYFHSRGLIKFVVVAPACFDAFFCGVISICTYSWRVNVAAIV